jgi:anaerobic magnesium-protoporphyrin IX monomethyl ester cyclase
MIDLLLVNPSSQEQFGELGSFTAIEPPFWAGLIATFIREHGFEVKIVDAETEDWSSGQTAEKIAAENPRLVVIMLQGQAPTTSSTPKMPAASRLLRHLKREAPEIKTMLWGIHPSALPEKTLREEPVDFVCQGEGFYTIMQLLHKLIYHKEYASAGLWYIENGQVIASPRAPLLNSERLPSVAYDLLPMDKYRAHNWLCLDNLDRRQPYGVTYTSLGCPYSCYFCSCHALYRGTGHPSIRFRNPEKVVEEIDLLVKKYGERNIKFMDEILNLREDHLTTICDLIIEHKAKRNYELNMWAEVSISTMTPRMLERMKRAGINWLAYGIESAVENVRWGISKRFTQERARKVIEMTQEAGIHIEGNFCFGLPKDTIETMQTTLDIAKEYNFEWVNFYCTMAYPGSELYHETDIPEDWNEYAQLGYEAVPMGTKYLTPGQVLTFRDRAFNEYFSRPEYLGMIRGKFGDRAVEHIEEMLKHKIRRRLLGA